MRCEQTLLVESDVLKDAKEGIRGQTAAQREARDVRALKLGRGKGEVFVFCCSVTNHYTLSSLKNTVSYLSDFWSGVQAWLIAGSSAQGLTRRP